MPTFTYKAIGADGSVAEGQIDAGNRPDAFRQMETLAEDGWHLVRQGITTVEEVLSVTTAKEVATSAKPTAPAAEAKAS